MDDDSMHRYDPALGHGLRHDPFNAIVGPRPIGWISSLDADGVRNLAPYSFFNAFNYTPPILGFASIGYKDSAHNVASTGTFVWNLATRPLARAMNASSAGVAPEVDEFALAGLTAAPSRKIDAPRVAESPVAFECVVTQQVRLQTKDATPTSSWMTFGEVVFVHIARSLIVDGRYDLAGSRTILRAGRGGDYIEVRPEAFFELPRPA